MLVVFVVVSFPGTGSGADDDRVDVCAHGMRNVCRHVKVAADRVGFCPALIQLIALRDSQGAADHGDSCVLRMPMVFPVTSGDKKSIRKHFSWRVLIALQNCPFGPVRIFLLPDDGLRIPRLRGLCDVCCLGGFGRLGRFCLRSHERCANKRDTQYQLAEIVHGSPCCFPGVSGVIPPQGTTYQSQEFPFYPDIAFKSL